MGIGSKLKKAAKSLDGKLAGLVKDPTSTQSLQTAGSLFTGVPIRNTESIIRDGLRAADGTVRQQSNQAIAKAKQDKAIKQGLWDLRQPLTKEGRQTMAVYGGYAVIVVGVVVCCVFTVAIGCGPAITGGITLATTIAAMDSKYKGEKIAEREAKMAASYVGPTSIPNMYPTSVGGAGESLLAGDFSGLFTSIDPNTAAGMKTLVFLGGLAAFTATAYFGVRYLRR